MDLDDRRTQYLAQVALIYADRKVLLGKFRGKAAKQALVQELTDLSEEIAARSCDADCAEERTKYCEPDSRGKQKKAVLEDMVSLQRAKLTEIALRVNQLKEELGV